MAAIKTPKTPSYYTAKNGWRIKVEKIKNEYNQPVMSYQRAQLLIALRGW